MEGQADLVSIIITPSTHVVTRAIQVQPYIMSQSCKVPVGGGPSHGGDDSAQWPRLGFRSSTYALRDGFDSGIEV